VGAKSRVDPFDVTTKPAALEKRAPEAWSLVVISDHTLRSHALPSRGDVVIGRTRDADIQLEDASISRRHAVLHVGAELELEDLGSQNGSKLAGRTLAPSERVTVAAGDTIELGEVLLVLQRHAALPGRFAPRLVIDDAAMKQLHRIVDRIAIGAISVLLLGETGVGKEVMARSIHERSPRAQAPFVSLNCAALSEQLLESELFGHEKGAFTGAERAKPGLLETADGGTLFLDEVGEMPGAIQAKLLRVLEERQVVRVGAVAPRPIDVRFISATNRDLAHEIARGAFRSDLYFRLNGISLVIPPLRERRSEIVTLAKTFVAASAKAIGRPAEPVLGQGAIARLLAHAWPGNIRELRNAMDRAVLLADDVIEPEHMPLDAPIAPHVPAPTTPAGAGLHGAVEQVERERILAAYERCGGNQSRTAIELGISRGTLTARLKAYGILKPRARKR
jgi:two-component system, NtrC family, response regulator AtoC